ncbi:hypothetical protein Q9L42_003540 [Methylomarinum sp. Ch1-1]|uniref:Uncharacterized protein n=1 Tax=Methylomarinum roseum TaxID=3067653 RepID=A0AAU7NX56_9GAMM|nr:hypothetical protein [Methylomarinum sp. Ch1-1]MDP4522740.1 hypothetical protein [Methylomarinum sp. Ch1-1]
MDGGNAGFAIVHDGQHRRAASRSKPPKPALGTKLALCVSKADCLSANPPYDCDAHVKPIVLKHIETWCASYRQLTLPHRVDKRSTSTGSASLVDALFRLIHMLTAMDGGNAGFAIVHDGQHRRAASRSKPPKPALGTKLALCVSKQHIITLAFKKGMGCVWRGCRQQGCCRQAPRDGFTQHLNTIDYWL